MSRHNNRSWRSGISISVAWWERPAKISSFWIYYAFFLWAIHHWICPRSLSDLIDVVRCPVENLICLYPWNTLLSFISSYNAQVSWAFDCGTRFHNSYSLGISASFNSAVLNCFILFDATPLAQYSWRLEICKLTPRSIARLLYIFRLDKLFYCDMRSVGIHITGR